MSTWRLAPWAASCCMTRWSVRLSFAMLFSLLASSSALAADRALAFGVLPYAPPTRLEAVFAPVTAHLTESLGFELRFRTATGSSQFLERLREGAYDVALVQPFYYVLAADELDYRPLARTDTPFVSVIVVRADGDIERVEQLAGQTVASTPRYSPPSILVRQALRDAGVDPEQDVSLAYMSSPAACLHQVQAGVAAACILGEGQLPQRVSDDPPLRIVLRTAPLPGMVLLIRGEISEARTEALRSALLSLDQTQAGRLLLESLGAARFVVAEDADYDGVRALLDRLEEPWLPAP